MKIIVSIVVCIAIRTMAASAANTIYVAQASAGANSGADCADAHSALWFNTASNWGAGSTQIGPGTTVHLCGAFTGTAGATELTVQGSGASGNPIIIQSDSASPAIFTNTYWNATQGAIYCVGQQYITIDGQNNGIIQNTANGSTLANHQQSEAIEDDCSNSTVQNWTISNIYMHVAGNSSDCTASGSCTDSEGVSVNNADHVLVTGNTIHDVRVGIGFNLPPSVSYASWEVSRNTIYNIDHGVTPASNASNTSIASALIHDNEIYNGSNWDSTFTAGACDWHHDGIHVFAQGGSSDVMNGVKIYNNYIHGLWTVTNAGSGAGCFNAHIYFEATIINPLIFNNVLELDAGPLNAPDGGYISVRGESSGSGAGIYNNTISVNPASTSGAGSFFQIVGEPSCIVSNNLITTNSATNATYDTETTPVSSNHNLFYTMGSYFVYPGNAFISLAAWQALGEDVVSVNGNNPNLSASFVPLSGSPAIGAGTNLTSLGVAALNTDRAGIARPLSGAWTVGAYQSTAAPNAPTNLVATAK